MSTRKPLTSQQKLRAALAKARRRGARLVPGCWDTGQGHVCVCGAVLTAAGVDHIPYMGGPEVIRRTAKHLGITIHQAGSLNNGFEGEPLNRRTIFAAFDLGPLAPDRKWYTIGKSLRRNWERRGRR